MTSSRKGPLVLSLALAAAVAGCGGSTSKSAGSGTTAANTKTYTIGVLTDETGAAASLHKTTVNGVKAGIVLAAREGYKVKYVLGDTATSPAGALAAAQKLVTQDHVLAVLADSSLTFTASNYLTAHHVPVVGMGADGPEWITAKNMFSIVGALHTTKVTTTMGKLFKMRGVTNLASLGYSISPASAEAAKEAAESARSAGIKVGYLNAQFPFGSTDVGPAVLAMKKAGIDGFSGSISPNTAFAIVTALRQQGVDLKVALLPSGYGGDLLQAGPGALDAAQNVYFINGFEPVEMQTPATRQFVSDLRSAGTTEAPTIAMYEGYISVGLFLEGLKAAGADPTQASLITALSNIHDFTAVGLYGSHKLDINDRENIVGGVDNCMWVTTLRGSSFTLVSGADPICGSTIPGKTVSPSS